MRGVRCYADFMFRSDSPSRVRVLWGLHTFGVVVTLCPHHKRAVNEWTSGVQDLAGHVTMRPLDNGRHNDRTRGQRAIEVCREQVAMIRTWCGEGRGCAGDDL